MDSETLRAAQLFIEMGLSSLTTIVWKPDQILSKSTTPGLESARKNLDYLAKHLDPNLKDPDLLESLNKALESGDPDSLSDNVLQKVREVLRIGFIQACRIYGLRAIETEAEEKIAMKRYRSVLSCKYAGPNSKNIIERMLYDSLFNEWESRQKPYRPGPQHSMILSSFS